jgi:hypothetical protein
MSREYENLFPEVSGTKATIPLSVVHNNPGAIMPKGKMATYRTRDEGIAASDVLLARYSGMGVKTLRQAISKWAPEKDKDGKVINATEAYVQRVAKATGIDPDAPIDLSSGEVRRKILPHMFTVESGQPTVTTSTQPKVDPMAPIQPGVAANNPLGVIPPIETKQAVPITPPRDVPIWESALRGFSQGVPLANKAQAFLRSFPYHLDPEKGIVADRPGTGTYQQLRDEGDRANAEAQAANPSTYTAGAMSSSIPMSLGAGGATGLAPLKFLAGQAALGGAYGAGKTGKDTGDVITNIAEQAAIDTALSAIPAVGASVAKAGRKAIANKVAEITMSGYKAAAEKKLAREIAARDAKIAEREAQREVEMVTGKTPPEISLPPEPKLRPIPIRGEDLAGGLADISNSRANSAQFLEFAERQLKSAGKTLYDKTGKFDPAVIQTLPSWMQRVVLSIIGGGGGQWVGGQIGEHVAPVMGIDPKYSKMAGQVIGGLGTGGVGFKIPQTGYASMKYPTTFGSALAIPSTVANTASVMAPTGQVEPSSYDPTDIGNMFPETDSRSSLQRLIDDWRVKYR